MEDKVSRNIYLELNAFLNDGEEKDEFIEHYPNFLKRMDGKTLYGSYLDLNTFFESEEERKAFIEHHHLEFMKRMNLVLNLNVLPKPNRDAVIKYAYDLFKVSTYFYCPAYILYNVSDNVITFGLICDYFHIDLKENSEWGELLKLGNIEIDARNDNTIELKFSAVGLLSKK